MAWSSGPWWVFRDAASGRYLWYASHKPDGHHRGQLLAGGRRLAWWRSAEAARSHIERLERDRLDFEVRVETGRRTADFETRSTSAGIRCEGPGHHEGPVRDYGEGKGAWCDYHAAPENNPHEDR
jgi:hypothetical protein